MALKLWDFTIVGEAAKLAEYSTIHRHKMGAILVGYARPFTVRGWNKKKTHPRFPTRSIHAEMDCLLGAARDGLPTMGATIYVARPRRDFTMGLAKPCDICQQYLKHAGVSRVIYTTPTGPKELVL